MAQGRTHDEVGEILKISRQRVGQLLGSGPRPERVLFARGPAKIVIGGKLEGGRDGDKTAPKSVASSEALAAAHEIQQLLSANKLEASIEVIEPPGLVDLNQPDLIVLGSPRILPLVGQLLPADPHLGFGQGPDGWYLTQDDEPMPSPCDDSGEPIDYAYIGRLPSPSGAGSFLYVAGVHAMGTLGGALYLVKHAEEIYRSARHYRWSGAVSVTYDPKTRTVTEAQELVPVRTY